MEQRATWRGKKIASFGFTALVIGAVLVVGRNVQRGGASSSADQITVTVVGEITKPGPVRLPKGSTVEYLLLQVRPKSTALLEGLDLNRQLIDGDRIAVPRRIKATSKSTKSKIEILDSLWAKELATASPDLIAKMLGIEKGLAVQISQQVKESKQGRGTIRWATDILTHPNVLQERWHYPKWVNAARLYAEKLLPDADGPAKGNSADN